MTNIFKSGRSCSIIFSDIIVPTSTIHETLQKWPKIVNYTEALEKRTCFEKNSQDKKVLASVIQNKR